MHNMNTDNRKLRLGQMVCFVDPEKVAIVPESGEGCLRVVGFDDGYIPQDEFWAIVKREDDRDFLAAGTRAPVTYIATPFENLHVCTDEDEVPTMPDAPDPLAQARAAGVPDVILDILRAFQERGYDIEVG